MYDRYAIYHAPEQGPLADFGAAWLGWDAVAGREVAHPDLAALPRPVAELTATPRRYGLHATLKPPFTLAPGETEAGLREAVAALARAAAPVRMEGLALRRLDGFVALMPEGETAPLAALAAEAVATLDPFRAPPAEAELARRRAAGLSPRQEHLMTLWGYPYVMEEFRFHITLTGRLTPAEAGAVEVALAPHLAPLLPRPFTVGALCLFGEAQGRFHLLHRYTLSG